MSQSSPHGQTSDSGPVASSHNGHKPHKKHSQSSHSGPVKKKKHHSQSSHSGPVKKKKHHSQSSHSGPVKKKKHNPTSANGGSSSSGGGSSRLKPEEGDYIINWHLQYCANIFLQYESTLRSLQDQIKAELMKIKTDGEFIKNLLPGTHEHLGRLKSEDRDLRSALDPINNLNDLFRLIAHRSAERLI